MLINPFTPSEIASQPQDFFGRIAELQSIERGLMQGSVAIQGAIGIGKSSLLSKVRLTMEGFDSDHSSISVVSVGHKDIKNVDEAARLLLESFVDVDETSKKIKFNLGKVVEIEAAEVCRFFAEGRHLAGLKRCIEKIYQDMIMSDNQYLILAIDEADKCPIALARLIRALSTHVEQKGIKRIRFATAGVNPYFQKMIKEDTGVNRFFYHVMTLTPMDKEEAADLISTKFNKVIDKAESDGIDLDIDPEIESRIVDLSGGHPHILQLLGSHVIEHENQNSDGIIDTNDLVNSLRTICYDNRSHAYQTTIHFISINNQYDNFRRLLDIADSSFPTIIDRRNALKVTDEKSLDWFVNCNVLNPLSPNDYGLMDEFLRIRVIMDEHSIEQEAIEKKLIKNGSIGKTHPNLIYVDHFADEYPEPLEEDDDGYSESSSDPLDFEDDL